MYPYHVYTEEIPVELYPLKDGRFQLIRDGKLGPFMSGPNYLLIERKLAQYLEKLNVENATFREAVILDRSKNEEHHSHKEVIVSQHFSSDEINDIDMDGDRILMMGNEYIFVSPSLKDKLEKSEFGYLRFSEGLSNFAG
jgi:hypothetical protein